MSFSSDIKEELSKVNSYHKECCMMAELTGYLITNCNIVKENNQFILKMSTENAAVIRRVYSLFKTLFQVTPATNMEKEKVLKDNLYQLRITDKFDLEKIFKESYINMDINLQIVMDDRENKTRGQECCRKAFLRGAFMGSGSIADPTNMYHLEVVTSNMLNATYISSIIGDIGIGSKIIKRKKDFVVYVKDSASIADFLAGIGSNNGIIKFEETRVVKDVRNNINRIVNCETANLSKTINASMKQIEDIKLIKKSRKYASLSSNLKEIASLRLNYSDATLKELGEMLNPKLSRSGVSHRLKKLEEIAENIREEGIEREKI